MDERNARPLIFNMKGVIMEIEILESAKKFFEPQICPKCGGKVKPEYYDPEYDVNIYKCENCKKELAVY